MPSRPNYYLYSWWFTWHFAYIDYYYYASNYINQKKSLPWANQKPGNLKNVYSYESKYALTPIFKYRDWQLSTCQYFAQKCIWNQWKNIPLGMLKLTNITSYQWNRQVDLVLWGAVSVFLVCWHVNSDKNTKLLLKRINKNQNYIC